MVAPNLTPDLVRQLFSYDPNTGIFLRKTCLGSRTPGSVAGSLAPHGYWILSCFDRKYYAHRLAWLYVYREWPSDEVDHINGVRSDNRIVNLRVVTRSVNHQNLHACKSHCQSGLLGAHVERKRYVARIVVAGKRKVLGIFDDPKTAHAAYLEAKRRLHAGCTI